MSASMRKPYIVDANYAMYDNIPVSDEMKGSKFAFGSNTTDTQALANWVRSLGKYDGVIVQNVREQVIFSV